MTVVATARLSLRELSEDDAPFIVRLLNEPSFLHFIGDRGVRTDADARAYLRQGPIASYRRNGFGLYLVERADDQTPLGLCGLVKREHLDDPDVGFAFLPEHWSRGYAIEAATAVMAYGRRELGLERIVAVVTPDNERSIAVLVKLGLRFERTVAWPGETTELELYSTGS